MARLGRWVMLVVTLASVATVLLFVTGRGSAAASSVLSVFVTNTAAHPVPVAQEGTAVQENSGLLEFSTDDTSAQKDFYTVPAGKQLQIQYVDGIVSYPSADDKPVLLLETRTGGVESDWIIYTPNQTQSPETGFLSFGGTHSATMYADAGTKVTIRLASRLPATALNGGAISFSGVLHNAP